MSFFLSSSAFNRSLSWENRQILLEQSSSTPSDHGTHLGLLLEIERVDLVQLPFLHSISTDFPIFRISFSTTRKKNVARLACNAVWESVAPSSGGDVEACWAWMMGVALSFLINY